MPVRDRDEAGAAAATLGFPAVLKTTMGGYDGRVSGSCTARLRRDAWREAKGRPLIWEQLVPFERASIIAARAETGEIVTFPPSENVHDHGACWRFDRPARVARDRGARLGARSDRAKLKSSARSASSSSRSVTGCW